MRRWVWGLLPVMLLAAAATAQTVKINGEADDIMYNGPYGYLALQDTQTSFGDASLGRPDVCDGSELDSVFGFVYGDRLYLVLTGNFQTNGNKLELFFDTRAGGQNRLLQSNPGAGLQRMSDDGSGNGLRFDTGIEPDFWVSVGCFGDPVTLYVDYAELYVDAGNPGIYYYCGWGLARCTTDGGALSGGDAGAPAILCTVDNSNVYGVTGGYGTSSGMGVVTGIEISIPLAAIGSPSGEFLVTAFINGQQHDWMSNQMLNGCLGTLPDGYDHEPRHFDFSTIFGDQWFGVGGWDVIGACCVGQTCYITTESYCTQGLGGQYLGDNTDCWYNSPCDMIPTGACCFDDGYAGYCRIRTQEQCAAEGGTYQNDGTTCEGCPCLLPPTGACCVEDVCYIATEYDCTEGLNGTYVGNYTNCDNSPCEFGACCDGLDCTDGRRYQCPGPTLRFFPGVACGSDPCAGPTIETPYVCGGFDGWATHWPMTETSAGSRIWQKEFTGLSQSARYEFKITIGNWDFSLPIGYNNNAWCFTDSAGTILVTYDSNVYGDGWVPLRDRFPLPAYSDPGTWTAVGDWQDGTPDYDPGDWTNNDPTTAMTSVGGGVYTFQRSGLQPGVYTGKAVLTGSWDAIGENWRCMDAGNLYWSIVRTNDVFTMTVDAIVGRIKVEVIPGAPCPTTLGDVSGDGLANNFDITPFVYALTHSEMDFATAYPGGHYWCADCSADGSVNNFDITPFVDIIVP